MVGTTAPTSMERRAPASVADPETAARSEAVARAFEEMGELLAIDGDNPFRVRAYERAAQVLRRLPYPLSQFSTTAELDALPGIGADLAAKIDEYRRTGHLRALDELRRKVPPGLRELLRIPGLGPARVRTLHRALGVSDLEGLRAAVRDRRLVGVHGLGQALQLRMEAALMSSGPRDG